MSPPDAAPPLPYVDEHAIRIDAPREVVWAALERYVRGSIRAAERNPLTRVLGTEPAAGFAVADRAEPERLRLAGRHRFSRYELLFELAEVDGGTQLRAQTRAEFPGLHGRLYRALVIGTRGHVVVTRYLLHSVRRRSLAPGATPA